MKIKLSDFILEQSISESSIFDIEFERLSAEIDVCIALCESYIKQYEMSIYQEAIAPPAPPPPKTTTTTAVQPQYSVVGPQVPGKQQQQEDGFVKKAAKKGVDMYVDHVIKENSGLHVWSTIAKIISTIFGLFKTCFFNIFSMTNRNKYKKLCYELKLANQQSGLKQKIGIGKAYVKCTCMMLEATKKTARYFIEGCVAPLTRIKTPNISINDLGKAHKWVEEKLNEIREDEQKALSFMSTSSYTQFDLITETDIVTIYDIMSSKDVTEIMALFDKYGNNLTARLTKPVDQTVSVEVSKQFLDSLTKYRNIGQSIFQQALREIDTIARSITRVKSRIQTRKVGVGENNDSIQ